MTPDNAEMKQEHTAAKMEEKAWREEDGQAVVKKQETKQLQNIAEMNMRKTAKAHAAQEQVTKLEENHLWTVTRENKCLQKAAEAR